MTFLAPVAGIVAGVLGLVGVLLSYFLKLRRRPVRVASTLLWEQAVQDLQVNAPLRMLRASWLLLLQLLVVACVAIALARPAIDGDGPDADRVVLVLDRSASMQAVDTPGGDSRFEAARSAALDRLDRLARDARVMVVSLAGSAETVVGLTRDHAAARLALRELEPTDQPDDLPGLMRLIGAFAQGQGEESERALPAVWVYTDGGAKRTSGLAATLPADRIVVERFGPDLDRFAQDGAENTGIVAVSLRRDFDEPEVVRLFARLINARRSEATASVRVVQDGVSVGAREVSLPAASAEGPGEASVTFSLRDSDGALVLLEIAGEDALAADNRAGLVLAAPPRPRVTVVHPDARFTVVEETLLDAILAAEVGEVRAISAEEAKADGAFAATDLVVFDGVRPDEAPPLPSISLGATIPGSGVSVTDGDTDPTRFAFWSRSHPVMQNLSIGEVVITELRDLRPPSGDGASAATAAFTELASGRASPLIVASERDGLRRLYLAFRVSGTNWYFDASWPVFMGNAIDWLTRASARAGAAGTTTARPAVIFEDEAQVGDERVLEGPGGVQLEAIVRERGRVGFGVLDRAGLYTMQGAAGPVDLAVNLADAHESSLVTAEGGIVAGALGSAATTGAAGARSKVEIWRWFVLAAAALLAAEWLVYAWKMRL